MELYEIHSVFYSLLNIQSQEEFPAHSRCSINISRRHESRAVQAESSLCLLFPDREAKKEAPGNEDLALLGL